MCESRHVAQLFAHPIIYIYIYIVKRGADFVRFTQNQRRNSPKAVRNTPYTVRNKRRQSAHSTKQPNPVCFNSIPACYGLFTSRTAPARLNICSICALAAEYAPLSPDTFPLLLPMAVNCLFLYLSYLYIYYLFLYCPADDLLFPANCGVRRTNFVVRPVNSPVRPTAPPFSIFPLAVCGAIHKSHRYSRPAALSSPRQ